MALSAGREEFAVAFVGKDELTGMVKDLEAKLKGLESQVKKTGVGGVGSFKEMGDGLRSATAGAASFKGGLASIKENVLGLPGIIGGIATAAVALGAAFADAFVRDPIKEFHDAFKRDFADLEKYAEALIARLRDVKGSLKDASTAELASKGALEELVHQADLQLASLRKQEEAARKTREALEGSGDVFERSAGLVGLMVDGASKERALQDEIHKIEIEREKANEKLLGLNNSLNTSLATTVALEAAAARERQKSGLLAGVQADTAAPLAFINALGQKYGKEKKSRTGGGGGGAQKGGQADLDALMQQWKDEDFAEIEHNIQVFAQQEERAAEEAQKAAQAEATYQELIGQWAAEDKAEGIKKQFDAVASLTEALGGLRDVVPEVGVVFDALGETFAKVREAGGSITDAIIGSVGPALKAGAAIAKSKKDGYYLSGLGEIAESAASFAHLDFWGGGAHLFAAGQFFAAAGRGGGGGGGSRGIAAQGGSGPRAGGASSGGGDSGPRTVVYNISAGVMDGQSVQRTIQRAENSARGTGWESRRGW